MAKGKQLLTISQRRPEMKNKREEQAEELKRITVEWMIRFNSERVLAEVILDAGYGKVEEYERYNHRNI